MSSKDKSITDDVWLEIMVNSFKHEISNIEQLQLDEWLSHSVKNREYYEELKEIWYTMSVLEEAKEFDDVRAFQNFKEKTRSGSTKKFRIGALLKYASILLLILGSSYLINSKLDNNNEAQLALNYISVPDGSTSKVAFKDGTKIWMNSNTELELVAQKRANERRVKLNGEAFLEVNRNEISPFTVETAAAEVKVLGTTFNVNAYGNDKELKVTLESGSVEVMTNQNETIKLVPGEQMVYDIVTNKFSVQEVNLKKELVWKTNNLIFTGESFEEIIELLERKFKVKIEVKNTTILNSRFSGDFVNRESLEQILDVMSAKSRFRYTYSKKENRIVIH